MLTKAKVERKLKWNRRSLTERAAEVVVDNLDKVRAKNVEKIVEKNEVVVENLDKVLKSNKVENEVVVDNMDKEISVGTLAREDLVETVAKEEDVLSQLELPKTLLPLLQEKLWRRDHFLAVQDSSIGDIVTH